MKWGDKLDYLRERARQFPDEPLPAPLVDEPQLSDAQEYVLESFTVLSQGRGYGMGGPLSISTADVAGFLMIHPICEPFRFLTIVRQLDALFMEQAYPPALP